MTPYSYIIGWTKQNKYYYGIQYSKNCHPDNLWVTYFTSSKKVKQFREKFGNPDLIQIRKTFHNKETCILWEIKVLRRLKVLKNEKWLNGNIAGMVALEFSNNERIKNGTHNFLKGNSEYENTCKRNRERAAKGNNWSSKHKKEWGKIISKHQKKLGAEGKMWVQSEEGRKFVSELRKSICWITNGVISKQLKIGEALPEGFRYGMCKRTKWITNGVISKQLKIGEALPEGFRYGRT